MANCYDVAKDMDKNWRTNPKYSCNVKVNIFPNKELLDFHKRWHNARRDINRYVYGYLYNHGMPVKDNGKPIDYNGWLSKDKETGKHIHPVIISILKRNNFFHTNHRRGILYTVHTGYKGYTGRNSKKLTKRPCNFGEWKAIRFKSTQKIFELQENKRRVKVSFGGTKDDDKLSLMSDLSCYILSKFKSNLEYISKDAGGNLVPPRVNQDKKPWQLILQARKSFSWLYTPINSVGLDINKDKDVSIVFSDGVVINFDEDIIDLINDIKLVNKSINNAHKNKTTHTTKERRTLRHHWKKLHKELKKRLTTICNNILNDIENKQQLICIDSVTSGGKNGEFGQQCSRILSELARKRNIPYVIVPTPYTSARCSICGYHHTKDNKKSQREFSCSVCSHTELADLNAARNIAYFGEFIWYNGIELYSNIIQEECKNISEKKNIKQGIITLTIPNEINDTAALEKV